MNRTRLVRNDGRWGWIGVVALALLSGCKDGKLMTFQEITQQQPAQQTKTETPQQTVITTPEVPKAPVEPPKPQWEAVVENFKKLRPGEIENSTIASLTALNEGLDQILEINAENSRVTDEGMTNLHKLTSLKTLALAGTKVSDKGCEAIGQVPSLEELTLTGGFITDAGMAHLANLKNLRRLVINATQMGYEGYEIIGQLPAIEEVQINNSSLDDESMKALCEASTLHSLRMTDTRITDKGLSYLGNLESLTYLNISGCPVTCEGLGTAVKGKKGLKKLIGMEVTNTPVNTKGAAAIGGMSSLENLNVAGLKGMDDKHLTMIVGGKKNLRRLLINNNPALSDKSLAMLAQFKQLEHLDISQNKMFTDKGLAPLGKLKKLKTLNAGDTSISQAAIDKLLKSITEANRSSKRGDKQEKEEEADEEDVSESNE